MAVRSHATRPLLRSVGKAETNTTYTCSKPASHALADKPLQRMEHTSSGDSVDEIFQHNKSFYQEDITTSQASKFRILGINAGQFSDPLVCRLRTVRLRRNLAYGALAYAWGDRADWESITVNGHLDFRVTANVAIVHRRLRHE